MLALLAIATMLLVSNHRAMTSAAFMLQRAETSYRQLDAYQQLSIETLEYIAANEAAAPERRQRIEERLRSLDSLVTFEVDLVADNGGQETNLVERLRVAKIHAIIEDIFTSHGPASAAAVIYQSRLKPLLDEAVNGEKAETIVVEQEMRDMQHTMLALGWLGILAQTIVAAVVLATVERSVLGPLKRLVSDIGEFGRGKLAHRVAVLRRDEFGLLAQHVNRMARHLDHRSTALIEINQALEATVARRTRALRDRNEELQEIDGSRRRFFVDVSHELRTPLTAIVGEADVTLRNAGADVGVCREALASVLANSAYLNRRIDDLMALARSSSGELELEWQTCDLNLVATEAATEVRSLARVNQVEVRFEPLTRPVDVEGDNKRLRQCLMILLDNAIKFSPAHRVVEMRLDVVDAAARLSVVDQGRGIDAAELPAVFERFYQTEVGRRAGGTGLGLAIARRITEAHNGTIAAAKATGGGAAVTITLPLKDQVSP